MAGRPLAYGETQPRLVDDSAPMLLIVLDGLGDRAQPSLGGATPSEAARTPVFDELARRGQSGWHLPFGHGRACSSEHAHWTMLGQDIRSFPGRTIIEASGRGLEMPGEGLHLYAALRTSIDVGGFRHITGRARFGADDQACSELFEALRSLEVAADAEGSYAVRLTPLARGEAMMTVTGEVSADITDSDPLFELHHPYMRPLPYADASDRPAAARTARFLERYLRAAHRLLRCHPVNVHRERLGLPMLDVLTTKWPSTAKEHPSFEEAVGMRGAIISDTDLYRGLALSLAMTNLHLPVSPSADLGADLEKRLDAAWHILTDPPAAGTAPLFALVHVKATDEAGHTKIPEAKVHVLEALDRGAASLLDARWNDAVVAITGDHASPSSHGVLHTGDPSPFVITAPTLRADGCQAFGERFARGGDLGMLRADDVLPVMVSAANIPAFSGTRVTSRATLALARNPEPLLLDEG